MKAQDLTGQDLADWVARALGWTRYKSDSVESGAYWHPTGTSGGYEHNHVYRERFRPDLAYDPRVQELLTSHKIGCLWDPDIDQWVAGTQAVMQSMFGFYFNSAQAHGETELIAKCRALVKRIYGEDELPPLGYDDQPVKAPS